ncbi:MAG TPA: dTDP-4-dehydrorhamnose reductase [bacterium]|nr:dTDP-4-dehydrorhamnose reductase [bacterium]
MRIILLGAHGILGRAVEKELGPRHQILARDLEHYDLRDASALIADLYAFRPAAVVNCAAYTRVDDAEDEAELCMEINGLAPGRLAAACRERNARFVHISTDYVYDGSKESAYQEGDATGPINAYGRSKLAGDLAVMEAHPDGHLILRASWLFGAGGKNFVKTMLGKWLSGERRFKVVNDQRGRPTYAADLARAIGAGLEKGISGLYHAANQGAVTWFEFAREIFEAAGAGEVTVEPVSSGEFPTKAKRPKNSVLDTSLLTRAGFTFPDHRDALARYIIEEGLQAGRSGAE